MLSHARSPVPRFPDSLVFPSSLKMFAHTDRSEKLLEHVDGSIDVRREHCLSIMKGMSDGVHDSINRG